jgi:Protein of unknown function (DUF3126)
MTPTEIARLQQFLRDAFGTTRIAIHAPARAGAPVELRVGGETLGTVHRDDDEGEISYSVYLSVLEEDLPDRA